ncbi:MAG: DUF86 domain-containing protein [Candidatus Omnitrophota bacterium]|nr:DUF86 domain-containing protein [Candidatus Omnitrophota bacterium]
MVNQAVIIAKMDNIRRNLGRLKEKQGITLENFSKDRDAQDIVLLNLQAAIQGCIDISSHIISDNNWGVPGSLGGLFETLYEEKVISEQICKIMRGMVGFRNLIVHEYAGVDMEKVYDIYIHRLGDINSFLKEIITYAKL